MPRVTIDWPARSRSLSAPSSALSATIAIDGDAPNSETFTVNRPASASASAATYNGPRVLPVGTYSITLRFFAGADGSGPVVAAGNARVYLDEGGQIPDITLTGAVASVVVAPGQSLTVGSETDLTVSATDVSGDVLALSPGSFQLAITSSTAPLSSPPPLQYDGGTSVTALTPGAARVTASVDGVASPAAIVTVTSDALVTVTPATASVLPGGSVALSASVANAPTSSVTWSIEEANGGSVSAGGVYTAPGPEGVYHVVAASAYDPAKTAVATITVEYGGLVTTVQ